jgi:hypothetical protein
MTSEALIQEYAKTWLAARPEISPELQYLVPEALLPVVATGLRSHTVPGAVLAARA